MMPCQIVNDVKPTGIGVLDYLTPIYESRLHAKGIIFLEQQVVSPVFIHSY